MNHNRWIDADNDGDGWSDEDDDFPLDPTEYLDTDGDEVPDHAGDACPMGPDPANREDGDGYRWNGMGTKEMNFPMILLYLRF